MTNTTTIAPAATQSGGVGLANAFGVGSVLAALGSLGYISLNWMDSPREAYMHSVGIVSCMVATAGIVVLALAVARWRTSLPGWAVLTAAAGLVFTAAGAWFFATGIVAIGEYTDDDLFEEIGTHGWMVAIWIPKIILCLIAFATLAVAGWRSRAIPRAASVAFGIAAVASLMPVHPPGILLASLAFFLVSRTQPESRT
jgi:hypothetical protein